MTTIFILISVAYMLIEWIPDFFLKCCICRKRIKYPELPYHGIWCDRVMCEQCFQSQMNDFDDWLRTEQAKALFRIGILKP